MQFTLGRPGLAFAAASVLALTPFAVQAHQEDWRLDRLTLLGGRPVVIEGHPQVVCAQGRKTVAFDGKADNLLVKGRPLVGARRFTIEALIMPEGGVFEQKFLHLAETDPRYGVDTRAVPGEHDVNNRIMFELRQVAGGFYIDGFINSAAGHAALAFPDKLHANGQWHAVAQTYDGRVYRTYVDGVLQGELATPFAPQGPGNVRIGSRMDRNSYFLGKIARVRFTDRALAPKQMLTASAPGATCRP